MESRIWTVADLVNALSGLPPMMEVFVCNDGIYMFVNHVNVMNTETRSPFVLIDSSEKQIASQLTHESYDERLARKKQVAMNMGHEQERANKMPPMVD